MKKSVVIYLLFTIIGLYLPLESATFRYDFNDAMQEDGDALADLMHSVGETSPSGYPDEDRLSVSSTSSADSESSRGSGDSLEDLLDLDNYNNVRGSSDQEMIERLIDACVEENDRIYKLEQQKIQLEQKINRRKQINEFDRLFDEIYELERRIDNSQLLLSNLLKQLKKYKKLQNAWF